MIELTKVEIEAYYRARVTGLRLIQGKLRAPCPIHQGKNPNFGIDQTTGQAFCHSSCSRGWDIFSLEMELSGVDFGKAKAEVFRIVGRPEPRWEERNFVATYDYTDAAGKLLYQVVRKAQTGQGRFSQRHMDAQGKWAWGLNGAIQVPYRLPELTAAKVVAVVEGEKDVHSMIRAGWNATCNNGGAGNFKPELVPYFAGRHVAIFPDNDEPGRKHAEAVARLLGPIAASLKVVEIPGLGLKGDVSDFLAAGGTGSQLRKLWQEAPDWSPEWQFTDPVPHENDKYLQTFGQAVKTAGGFDEFWRSVEIDGLPTPFDGLTRSLGGLRKGEVYVIGARTGQGKTSLALQFAVAAMDKRAGVLVFSMEMGHRDCFQRIAASHAAVDLGAYRKARREWPDSPGVIESTDALRQATNKFAKSPLYVSTKSGITVEFLIEESKRIKERCPIGLIIVDHMQLMGETGKRRSDYEKFTAISRTTKEIAVDLNVPLILVSQVSRNNAADRRAELEMSDLRGSGAIEEDAAGILLLFYDAEDLAAAKVEADGERMKRGPIKTWLKLAKNRFGPSGGRFALNHWKGITRFDLEDKA